jgi:hypothetical protein
VGYRVRPCLKKKTKQNILRAEVFLGLLIPRATPIQSQDPSQFGELGPGSAFIISAALWWVSPALQPSVLGEDVTPWNPECWEGYIGREM